MKPIPHARAHSHSNAHTHTHTLTLADQSSLLRWMLFVLDCYAHITRLSLVQITCSAGTFSHLPSQSSLAAAPMVGLRPPALIQTATSYIHRNRSHTHTHTHTHRQTHLCLPTPATPTPGTDPKDVKGSVSLSRHLHLCPLWGK